MTTSDHLLELTTKAMSESGFITVMGEKSNEVKQDVPAAFEMLSLLECFLPRLCFFEPTLDENHLIDKLHAGVSFDRVNKRVRALVPVSAGELPEIAYWIADRFPSDAVKALPGILALMFSVETFEDTEFLIPEWFCTFFVDGSVEHAFPILALRSILNDPGMNPDWVRVALLRMQVFGLPSEAALNELKKHDETPKTT